jgi:glycosyltransferase involved in cell wall biosynthesis
MIKIVVLGSVARSLINFRGPLLQELVERGLQVIACAPEASNGVKNSLHSIGVQYRDVNIERTGLNPIKDLNAILGLFGLFRKIKPDIILGYTVKPVIYGSLAASFAGVERIYSMIEGLGYSFSRVGLKGKLISVIIRFLYRLSMRTNKRIFFLNPDDLKLFSKFGILTSKEQAILINGIGVDTDYYSFLPLPSNLSLLMIARFLKDKGIREYVESARYIKRKHPNIPFRAVGTTDTNPLSISRDELEGWTKEGILEYLGELPDVRPAIAKSSVFVLPSYYREGMPRTVLEAMSMGRPIITTDAPGCRETVRLTPRGKGQRDRGEKVMEGENGFLIRPRDVKALVMAIEKFLEDPSIADSMGERSREIAEEKFDVHKVNAVILKAMGLI